MLNFRLRKMCKKIHAKYVYLSSNLANDGFMDKDGLRIEASPGWTNPVYPLPLVLHTMQMSPPAMPPLWFCGLVAETVRQRLGIGFHGPTD
ncbi:hypothetical protein HPB47_014270 [Ixodes persulcatus]|uniref:Uncharacterized protein n=1 Tax=Ixodes persulcatus TaxID=34615 RepID=A0AC60QWE4_IXOPE|nr:hypothetical protein HPB47_014270 [Ixodes persulcatus]